MKNCVSNHRVTLLSFLVTLLLSPSLFAEPLASYHNARYGFSLSYPSSYHRGEEAANRDGCSVHSPDEQAEILVYGSNNLEALSLEQAYDQATKHLVEQGLYTDLQISYSDRGNTWFVLSWTEEQVINYRKTFVGRGSTNTLWVRYPATSAHEFQSLVELLEANFQPGDTRRSH